MNFEIISLPTWANIVTIIAVLALVGMKLYNKFAPKVGSSAEGGEYVLQPKVIEAKPAYYIASIAICVALAAFFCIAGGICTSLGVLISYGVILFFGLIACAIGEGEKNVIMVTAAIVVICLILATLVFSNAAFAAIWISVVGALFFGGHLLFPSKK